MNTSIRRLLALSAALVCLPNWAASTPTVKSLDDIGSCVQSAHWAAQACLDATRTFGQKNPKQQFDIGKRVRLHYVHWAALPYFDAAMDKAPSPAQCADPDVALAVVSGLNLPPGEAPKTTAERLLSGSCFAALRPAAEKALQDGGATSYEGQSICSILGAKGVPHAVCAAKPAVAAAPSAAPAALPVVDLAKAQFNLVKVFRGHEGERMTMAEVQGQADVFVLRFDGIRGAWNGKTLVHQLENGSNQSNTLWTLHNGQRWATLHTQGSQRTAYVPGSLDGMVFWYSEEDSKKASADQLR